MKCHECLKKRSDDVTSSQNDCEENPEAEKNLTREDDVMKNGSENRKMSLRSAKNKFFRSMLDRQSSTISSH